MNLVIFSGPTLAPDAAQEIFPGATCHGPAAQGDVLRAVRKRPDAICVIDGYFEHVPAVTHKEILWALSKGIAVFGAASIGALRAAELGAYGMRGHGQIFEAYAAGLLEDDDEVAVVHEEAAHGYRGCTEALVNLRATLQRAVAAERVALTAAHEIIAKAKELFYADRDRLAYAALIKRSLGAEQGAQLFGWMSEHWVDQKRIDCMQLLERVKQNERTDWPDSAAALRFVRTAFWDALVREVQLDDERRHSEDNALVLEEIRLLGPKALNACEFAATRRALCRALAKFAGSADPELDLERVMSLASTTANEELPAIVRMLPHYAELLVKARRGTS